MFYLSKLSLQLSELLLHGLNSDVFLVNNLFLFLFKPFNLRFEDAVFVLKNFVRLVDLQCLLNLVLHPETVFFKS